MRNLILIATAVIIVAIFSSWVRPAGKPAEKPAISFIICRMQDATEKMEERLVANANHFVRSLPDTMELRVVVNDNDTMSVRVPSNQFLLEAGVKKEPVVSVYTK